MHLGNKNAFFEQIKIPCLWELSDFFHSNCETNLLYQHLFFLFFTLKFSQVQGRRRLAFLISLTKFSFSLCRDLYYKLV